MVWKIEFEARAGKELAALDKSVARRISAFLIDRVAKLDDPRSIGDALKGSKLGEFWKYRVGDWRFVARIDDRSIRVIVVRLGNRRLIYR